MGSKKKGTSLRVNIGGPRYRDSQGQVWEKDKQYSPGAWGCLDFTTTDLLSTKDKISGTQDAALFQTMRMGEEMRYRFDLPQGNYQVRILFAEIYWETSDAELQEVHLQGKRGLSDFNIFDEAGHDAALEKTFTTKVTKGSLEVRFVGLSLPMHSGARACAIEVKPITKK